jgi:uncharacterized protein (UPF0210 family)
MRNFFARLVAVFVVLVCASAPAANGAAQKVKIRAITAFVQFDRNRAHLESQFNDALKLLQKAKAVFTNAGYEVQTIRITPQAFGVLTRGLSRNEILSFYAELADLDKKAGIPSAIGPAFLHAEDVDTKTVDIYAEVLSLHTELNGCLLVADEDGVNWKALHAAARVMKYLEDHTAHSQGNFQFAAAAEVADYFPFYPASYFVTPGKSFAVAIEGADIATEAFSHAKGDLESARKEFTKLLDEQTTAIAALGAMAHADTKWDFLGIDTSTAPLGNNSIGAAFETLLGGAPFGSAGTLSIASMITDVLHTQPRSAGSGYSGLMMPVLEDSRLAQRWGEGRLGIDQLLQYSAVCGTGLDTVPLPGDVTEDQLARIIGDVATLAAKLNKPLVARLLPIAGKKAGDRTELDSPYLTNTILQPLR